ncbi:MAG: YiiX/YebB-like N1pC/P60 family cysteine hydrolase [Phycisphaerales bacterium]|nr:YiiX/YebB-like N1pC/P60 family cysteine hydrolase [Phycisphaerales bacterium]
MHPIISKLGIKPADRIVVPKSGLRIVQHHAIYLGQNKFGHDLIAENKIGFGVRMVTADEFFKDVIEVTRIERFNGSNHDRNKAIEKALLLLGKEYNLIGFNCENYANTVQHKSSYSNQVKTGLGVFVALMLGVIILND